MWFSIFLGFLTILLNVYPRLSSRRLKPLKEGKLSKKRDSLIAGRVERYFVVNEEKLEYRETEKSAEIRVGVLEANHQIKKQNLT